MQGRAILGGAGPVSALVAALLVAAGLGWYVFSERRAVEEERQAADSAMVAPAGGGESSDGATSPESQSETADSGPTPTGDSVATTEPKATAPIAAPGFDLVRVDADGGATVAGTAPAQYEVAIEVDGIEITRAQADGSGQFAALFEMPKSEAAQVIFLIAHGEGGKTLRSETSVIIAPRQVDGQIAEATPVPDSSEPAETLEMAALAPLSEGSSGGDNLEATSQSGDALPDSEEIGGAADGGEPTAEEGSVGQGGAEQTSGTAEKTPELGDDTTAEPESLRTQSDPVPVHDDADDATAQTDTAAVEPATKDGAAETAATTGGASDGDTRADPAQSASSLEPVAPAAADTADGAPAGSQQENAETQKRAPAVLLADDEGVRLLQPSDRAPQVQDQVVIDVISYDESGEVLLEGRGGAGEGSDRVQVYLNNAPIRTSQIGVDGTWRTPLPQVDTGIYTLRVDQVDAAGRVASRFETPFKREDPEVLASVATASASVAANAPGGVAASVITVQPGYTLWGIASDRYGDGFRYVQIFEANKDQIRDPDLIYPGQVFDLPDN